MLLSEIRVPVGELLWALYNTSIRVIGEVFDAIETAFSLKNFEYFLQLEVIGQLQCMLDCLTRNDDILGHKVSGLLKNSGWKTFKYSICKQDVLQLILHELMIILVFDQFHEHGDAFTEKDNPFDFLIDWLQTVQKVFFDLGKDVSADHLDEKILTDFLQIFMTQLNHVTQQNNESLRFFDLFVAIA